MQNNMEPSFSSVLGLNKGINYNKYFSNSLNVLLSFKTKSYFTTIKIIGGAATVFRQNVRNQSKLFLQGICKSNCIGKIITKNWVIYIKRVFQQVQSMVFRKSSYSMRLFCTYICFLLESATNLQLTIVLVFLSKVCGM